MDNSGDGERDRGFRIEKEAGAREGDAVGDAGAGRMQVRKAVSPILLARPGPRGAFEPLPPFETMASFAPHP